MEASEVLKIISKGESSRVQFKERMPHVESMAQELVAFSNSEGGTIIFGVNDKTGDINGLNFTEIASINSQLANIASNNVLPPVMFTAETVTVNGHNLVVISVPIGDEKPYKDRSGGIYMKVGADKRKITSNVVIARLLQRGKYIYADEMQVQGVGVSALDINKFSKFLKKRYDKKLSEFKNTLEQILENLDLAESGVLTLAGVLLFGENCQKHRKMFTIQCVAVDSDDITCDKYSDIENSIEGTLDEVYSITMGFINRNMRKIPENENDGFNTHSMWEIPRDVFVEFIVNALIHRDYFINSTVKVFIFPNRVEITSPGSLPNKLNIEKVKNGISVPRNPVLNSIARDVLPYVGLGGGVLRAYSLYPHIILENDTENEQFKVTIMRNVIE